ncbi:nickel pincer cofactor biosynthesis protein LarC [Treponema sp.]|uniref:nickel pincer cofactor biosynthesis protein LarC n=1 Tax=Treponema sp. TaxID=166 RepID=UPI003EFD64ED
MNSLYFECNAGISGDMAVAAMIDMGADKETLMRALDSIQAEGFAAKISRAQKNGIDCASFDVILDSAHENHDHDMSYLFGNSREQEEHTHCHEHRTMTEISQIISTAKMTEKARTLALKIFQIIAEAESEAHGIPAEEVHFHEVGALDSIADVIALAVCFENLRQTYGIEKVYVPFLCEGRGTVRCQHGILPIPVPAVANIARKYSLPLLLTEDTGEFVTPTGAAFAAAVMTDRCAPKTFLIRRTGLGAGKRAYSRPNILRAFLIEESDFNIQHDTIIKLEANIDDSSGEALGFALEKLFEAGALDVNFIPCFMKKNRPAYLLTVLCTEEKITEIERFIFLNTTTIGIRKSKTERTILPRQIQTVKTKWGEAKVKTVSLYGAQKFYPEYESVRTVCEEHGLPFDTVYREIAQCAEKNSSASHGE